jgi:hypothetical protein
MGGMNMLLEKLLMFATVTAGGLFTVGQSIPNVSVGGEDLDIKQILDGGAFALVACVVLIVVLKFIPEALKYLERRDDKFTGAIEKIATSCDRVLDEIKSRPCQLKDRNKEQ